MDPTVVVFIVAAVAFVGSACAIAFWYISADRADGRSRLSRLGDVVLAFFDGWSWWW
jgi:hypothetical protein